MLTPAAIAGSKSTSNRSVAPVVEPHGLHRAPNVDKTHEILASWQLRRTPEFRSDHPFECVHGNDGEPCLLPHF